MIELLESNKFPLYLISLWSGVLCLETIVTSHWLTSSLDVQSISELDSQDKFVSVCDLILLRLFKHSWRGYPSCSFSLLWHSCCIMKLKLPSFPSVSLLYVDTARFDEMKGISVWVSFYSPLFFVKYFPSTCGSGPTYEALSLYSSCVLD